ncbi:MFS transporter [Bacteriovorax sp. PP10]|uniref:MFS transporter n=1 Tax=Bacteriovorax antarcticus TaxID=3088717 RepID=A0ABU5VVN6_9BACT|nr:MFS transporter [Bacteriovorax sp. PP10]MEA9356090.1 MFS transporter [Bacteriovorax sp. PP10]
MLSYLANLNTITFSAVQILLFTMFPFIAESLNLSLSLVIGVFSLGSFLFLWSGPYWSSKSDFAGRMKILNVGMIGQFVSFLLLFLLILYSRHLPEAVTIALLVISRIIYGAFSAAIIPVAQALQLDLSVKETYLKSMLSNSMSLNLGRMIGPIYVLVNGDSPIGLMKGVLVWLVFIMVSNFLCKKLETKQRLIQKEKMIFDWSLITKELKWVFLLALLFTCFIGTLHNTFGLHIKELFDLDAPATSILMAKFLLGSSIMAVVSQFVSKRFFNDPWQGPLIIGAFTLFCGAMGFALGTTSSQVWMSMMVVSIGIAMIPPSYLTLTTFFSPSIERGKKFGMINAANTIGYTVGGFFTAVTLKLFSHDLALIITTSVLVSAIVLTIIVLQKKRIAI